MFLTGDTTIRFRSLENSTILKVVLKLFCYIHVTRAHYSEKSAYDSCDFLEVITCCSFIKKKYNNNTFI